MDILRVVLVYYGGVVRTARTAFPLSNCDSHARLGEGGANLEGNGSSGIAPKTAGDSHIDLRDARNQSGGSSGVSDLRRDPRDRGSDGEDGRSRGSGRLAVCRRRIEDAKAGAVHHNDGAGLGGVGNGIERIILVENRSRPDACSGQRKGGGRNRRGGQRGLSDDAAITARFEMDGGAGIHGKRHDRVHLVEAGLENRRRNAVEQQLERSLRKGTKKGYDFPGRNRPGQHTGGVEYAFRRKRLGCGAALNTHAGRLGAQYNRRAIRRGRDGVGEADHRGSRWRIGRDHDKNTQQVAIAERIPVTSDEQAPSATRTGRSGIEQLGRSPCPGSGRDPDIERGVPFEIELQAADGLAFGGKRNCGDDGLTGAPRLVL